MTEELRNNAPIIPGAQVKADPAFADLFDADGNVKAEQAPPQPIQTNLITNTQAGAEFNVFFKTPAGFKAHLKLHGVSGRAVLEQSAGALLYLATHGFTPEYAAAPTAAEPTREDLPSDGTASASFCTIHNCEMKRREKDNQVWYSHKISGTEDWCRGPK